MRFIQDLSPETLQLLQKIYQKSHHHRVRQRAQCLLLSYQGYTIRELAFIFKVDHVTIYNWFNSWEATHFAGLYDKKGKGRPPLLQPDHKEQIRQWAKAFPKNLNKIRGLIVENFGIEISKQTLKRVLKALGFSWRRMRRCVKGQPDPATYEARKAALDTLRAEDHEGIIDLRYYDESGFC